ncbi:lantibiotic protection ABC transporter ATP-binding subunit [Peptostreptococcus equinus]|uniref:Lantibiotic protection ABC transporter ATP-binding subunit n=2 Tax=Peptostreptococcus equinus TaxID=3003601 RepID=A0ABY7JRU5_9FIRM|nr:lantibiotic protection ABC transporter ATP-binding subunit [Peptostreptococcus sp. CBA3647]WAW15874.1 lantibiotic protection ABC transporter ATP-binding subunit [Peptostreptococcus sp. CBA3647]
MMKNIIETKGISKKFKNSSILENVSISVKKGSVYGLLGPNGAGKSTLLKILCGSLKASEGSIIFDGHKFSKYDLKHIGSIIEYPSIYPNLTARENLQILTTMLDLDKSKIDESLKLVNLENTGKKIVKNFSMGMKQRLGIAMALINNPQLLILDEPTNGLDPLGIQEMRELIKSLSAKGITIIISSHILNEIQQVADTIGIIYQGMLCYENVNDKNSKDLEELFLEIIKRKRR